MIIKSVCGLTLPQQLNTTGVYLPVKYSENSHTVRPLKGLAGKQVAVKVLETVEFVHGGAAVKTVETRFFQIGKVKVGNTEQGAFGKVKVRSRAFRKLNLRLVLECLR